MLVWLCFAMEIDLGFDLCKNDFIIVKSDLDEDKEK
jgi:hypothetical protein